MRGFDYKVERLRHDLSQWELARLANVPPYRISAWERGRVQLSHQEIVRIKQALRYVAKENAARG